MAFCMYLHGRSTVTVHTASRYLTPAPAMATVHWDSMLDTSTSQKKALPPRQRSILKIYLGWDTVDRRNPAPPGMHKTLQMMEQPTIVTNPNLNDSTKEFENLQYKCSKRYVKKYHLEPITNFGSSTRDVWRWVVFWFHPNLFCCWWIWWAESMCSLFFPVMFLSSLQFTCKTSAKKLKQTSW